MTHSYQSATLQRPRLLRDAAPLPLPGGLLLGGPLRGDEPGPRGAGGERGAVLGLRPPGAQQADEAPRHQVPDPQHPAAGAGAQHQPGRDPPAAPQGASSHPAAGAVRPAGGQGGGGGGGGRRPRHHRDHHHHGHRAQSRGRADLLLPLQPQPQDPAPKHPARSAVGSPAGGRRGHRRLPADLPPAGGGGGERHAGQGPPPGGGGRLLAERGHQVSAAGLAASTGGQVRDRDQRLRLRRHRPGGDLGRARRGRAATLHRGEDPRHPQKVPPGRRPPLRRGVGGDPLLPLPAHRGLRGVRLGLDHRPQALPGQLLLRRVRVHAPAAVPARAPGEQGQPARHGGALLHAHQDVAHQHALLQPQGTDHLREDPVHGGRPLRLLLSPPPAGLASIPSVLSKKAELFHGYVPSMKERSKVFSRTSGP